MRGLMKRLITLALCLVLALQLMPLDAAAAVKTTHYVVEEHSEGAKLLEITKDGAPLRSGPDISYSIELRCQEGAVLEEIGIPVFEENNIWYEVSYKGENYYIYSKNVKKHVHNYETITPDEITYAYCDCGNVKADVTNKTELKQVNAVAIPLGEATWLLPAVDGPSPVGDVIAVCLWVIYGAWFATSDIISTNTLVDILEKVDLDEVEKDRNSCPKYTYRKVMTTRFGLKYIDSKCMNPIMSYAYVKLGGNVYCRTREEASSLGMMYAKGTYRECHDNPNFYWHFHLGGKNHGKISNKVGGHIFYGSSKTQAAPV